LLLCFEGVASWANRSHWGNIHGIGSRHSAPAAEPGAPDSQRIPTARLTATRSPQALNAQAAFILLRTTPEKRRRRHSSDF